MSMQQEVYEAFRDLGVSEEKALKAATALGRREDINLEPIRRDVADLRQRLRVLEWMMGVVLAFQIAILVKLFVH